MRVRQAIGGLALLAAMGAVVVLGTVPAAAPAHAAKATLDPATFRDRAIALVAAGWDSARGGWVTRLGEPISPAIALGFALERDRAPGAWGDRARSTVEWMWSLYDSVGGGFYHSVASVRGDNATFEKNAADNAERLENLIDATLASHDEKDRRRAARIADYFDRVLLDGRGGFVGGQGGDRDLVPHSNGLAIHAWLRWSALTAHPALKDFALKSLDRLFSENWHDSLGLVRRNVFGELTQPPQLEDQIECGRACVLAAHLGGRAVDLERARRLADRLERLFVDPEHGGWRTQAMPDKNGRIKNAARDPSENARAARFLAELASVSGEARWRAMAQRVIAVYAIAEPRDAAEAAEWTLALRAMEHAELPAKPVWVRATAPPPPKRHRY